MLMLSAYSEQMDELHQMSEKHARILLRVKPAEMEPLMREILDLT